MKLINASLLKSTLLKDSAIYLLFDTLSKIIPFLILPILTRYLSTEDMGLINNFNIYQSIILIIIGLNTSGAILANFGKLSFLERGSYISQALYVISVITPVVVIIITAGGNWIGSFTGLSQDLLYLGALLAIFQSLFNIRVDLYKIERSTYLFGIYQCCFSVINFAVSTILIIQFNLGYSGRIWGIAISVLLLGLISFVSLVKTSSLTTRLNKEYLKDILNFGIPLIPHSLSFWIRNSIDRLFLTSLLGLGAVGIYSTSFQLTIALSFITLAFNNAYIPYLYEKLSTLNTSVKKHLLKLSFAYILGVLILAVVLGVLGKLFVKYFLGKEFFQSAQYLLILFLAQAFNGIYQLFGNYLFYYKKTKELAAITFVSSIIHIGISKLCITYYGIAGASYAYLFTSILISLWVAFSVNKIVKFSSLALKGS